MDCLSPAISASARWELWGVKLDDQPFVGAFILRPGALLVVVLEIFFAAGRFELFLVAMSQS